MGEPAWEGAGQELGLQIWRIVVSRVVCGKTERCLNIVSFLLDTDKCKMLRLQ